MEIAMENILELWMVILWILCALKFCMCGELQDVCVWKSNIAFCYLEQ